VINTNNNGDVDISLMEGDMGLSDIVHPKLFGLRIDLFDSVSFDSPSSQWLLNHCNSSEEIDSVSTVNSDNLDNIIFGQITQKKILNIRSGIASWDQEIKLLASDGAINDYFGTSVAISGDVALIGSRYDDDNGYNSGSAYVYRFDGSSWQEEAKLLASDGAAYDLFGISVAIDGNLALIGAMGDDDNGGWSGSAYVYRFDGDSWQEEAKLLPSDGADWDYFGRSVAIDGNLALIGAWGDDDNGTNSGRAYIFDFDGVIWQETKLTASDGVSGDNFGSSVAIDGSTVVVGAQLGDDNEVSIVDSGGVYVYFKNTCTGIWDEEKLSFPEAEASSLFGSSVAISGD
ncbi:MAG: FG-GAP repeat protein, partial [Anaerolineales bacterium]|nr:FG-GAP repeat protein [Anaerolineales bacterium]